MSNESPAAILFDEFGNPIGVQYDGYVYRLQTQSTLTDTINGPVAVTPPNTVATSLDPALVVAISPNNNQVKSTLTDGYGNGPAAITAPNTPAVASDPAIVVAISPNNSFNVDFAKPSTVVSNNIPASGISTTLLAYNATRIGATIYNDSRSGFLYINLDAPSDSNDFVIKLLPLDYYEIPFGYIGSINGCWSNPSGFARVSEFNP